MTAAPQTLVRSEIPDGYKWDLSHIFAGWADWEGAYRRLEGLVEEVAALQGTLDGGPQTLLHALRRQEELERLSQSVWWYPSLMHDQDLRDNAIEARRQRVSILLSQASTATAWFNPELLAIPLERLRSWMGESEELAVYRFLLEDLHRQKEHVLDGAGERLLSYASQLADAPGHAYSMLSTADVRHPTVELSTGETVTLTYAQYHHLLATARAQDDRALAFRRLHELYAEKANSFAALYNGVCQRDWFYAQSRRYPSTLDAALDGDAIPTSVVHNLLQTTKAGASPLRRYLKLRRKVLGLREMHLYDTRVALLETDRRYPYDEARELVLRSVGALGEDYQRRVEEGFAGGWIDVYENEGKRNGAYSAPVYGIHPYMLLNYKDTLEDMFTLAHEMGHTMHTQLSHESQPFVYSDYTIFVAEVASTLNEALLLDTLLERTRDAKERALLLQHAIGSIVGTFYTQVLFADYELQAHRLVEQGEPVTADSLSGIYWKLLEEYYGDAVVLDELGRFTWARIPHFYRSPYYVYQYATCFASAALIKRRLTEGEEKDRRATLDRYLTLLRAGGNDHPMEQLRKAGVDLSEPATVQAVVHQLDRLVGQLEVELSQL